jgi:hypothetical protein
VTKSLSFHKDRGEYGDVKVRAAKFLPENLGRHSICKERRYQICRLEQLTGGPTIQQLPAGRASWNLSPMSITVIANR